MKQHILHVESLRKDFNRRTVFSDISFEIRSGQSIAITGKNGSGKSTLAKILSGVLSPTSGKVLLECGGSEIPARERHEHIGFVSPYLQLYDEFSALENLRLCASLRGIQYEDFQGDALLDLVDLSSRKNDPVRIYSSGMKQRLKYAFALLHRPYILILDEPTANLDSEGIEMATMFMKTQCDQGILIIATNDKDDLRHVDTAISVEKGRGR
ncbi:MAG: ABC transporter ATP-binding protein [Bacteroidota bacterium]